MEVYYCPGPANDFRSRSERGGCNHRSLARIVGTECSRKTTAEGKQEEGNPCRTTYETIE